jgi:hypothetical protein
MGRMGGSGVLILDAATFRQNGLFLANARGPANRPALHEEMARNAIDGAGYQCNFMLLQYQLSFA